MVFTKSSIIKRLIIEQLKSCFIIDLNMMELSQQKKKI